MPDAPAVLRIHQAATSQRRSGNFTNGKKYPLVTMGRPIFAPKITPSRLPIPNPHCLIHGPVRPNMPNGIWIRSAVFPQCIGQTYKIHRQTHRPTDGYRESSRTIGRLRYRQQRGLTITKLACGQHCSDVGARRSSGVAAVVSTQSQWKIEEKEFNLDLRH